MGFARQVAHRVVFMDRGEIVESGPPNELFENPRTDRLKLFLSQILRGALNRDRRYGKSTTVVVHFYFPDQS